MIFMPSVSLKIYLYHEIISEAISNISLIQPIIAEIIAHLMNFVCVSKYKAWWQNKQQHFLFAKNVKNRE